MQTVASSTKNISFAEISDQGTFCRITYENNRYNYLRLFEDGFEVYIDEAISDKFRSPHTIAIQSSIIELCDILDLATKVRIRIKLMEIIEILFNSKNEGLLPSIRKKLRTIQGKKIPLFSMNDIRIAIKKCASEERLSKLITLGETNKLLKNTFRNKSDAINIFLQQIVVSLKTTEEKLL